MSKRPILGGVIFTTFCVGTAALMYVDSRPLQTMEPYVTHAGAPAIKKFDAAARVFGHPMVPGGIHNIDELRQNSGLYPGLNVENARFMALPHGTFAYVSYQKNGVTYWTKHTRWIPTGEQVIFDGHVWILQRCGNLLRWTDPLPIETLDFDEPEDLYPPITLVPEVAPPNINPPVETTVYVPPVVGPPPPIEVATPNAGILMPPIVTLIAPVVGTPPVVVDTPEPSSILMLFVGLLLMIPMAMRRLI